MPDPGSIEVGKAHVEVSADNSTLDAKITEAKAKTEELGDSAVEAGRDIESGFRKAEDAVDGTGNKTEKLEGSFSGATKAVETLQRTIGKIAIPAAIATGVVAIITKMIQLNAEAIKYRQTLGEIAATHSKFLQEQAKSVGDNRDAIRQTTDAIRAQGAAQKDRISAETNAAEASMRGANAVTKAYRSVARVLGADIPTAAKIAADGMAELDRISVQTENAVRRLRERLVKDFENQTALLKAQAEGAEAVIAEQLRQLTEDHKEQIESAESEAIANALQARFEAMRALLVQQLQDIQDAKKAQIDADAEAVEAKRQAEREADQEKRRREEEDHQRRLREIEAESQKRIKALDDYFRKQEEGFDRLNQDLIVGLKGIATAVQQNNRTRDNTIVLGGGA